jgi:hypothetical protein
MNRVALGLGLLSLLCLNLYAIPQQSKADESAVRDTVTDYIEGYYTGDAARMEKSMHPHYLKHTVKESHGKLHMSETTGLQMLQNVKMEAGEVPPSERKEQITVLDISGDIASAKLVTPHWVDYLTLTKWNGDWKIVSVVLRENQ